jgi:hypothetical protein
MMGSAFGELSPFGVTLECLLQSLIGRELFEKSA